MTNVRFQYTWQVIGMIVLLSSCSNDPQASNPCLWSLSNDISYYSSASPGSVVDWSISTLGEQTNSSKNSSDAIRFIERVILESSRWLLLQDIHVESYTYDLTLLSNQKADDWRLYNISVNDVGIENTVMMSIVPANLLNLTLLDFPPRIDLSQFELGVRDGSVAYIAHCLDGSLTRGALYALHGGFPSIDFPTEIDASTFKRLAEVITAVEELRQLPSAPVSVPVTK